MSSVNQYIKERYDFAMSRLTKGPMIFPGKNTFIGRDVKIGKDCIIGHNVVITGKVEIGDCVIIKSNTVIGEKGFSFGFTEDLVPIPIYHDGGVIIGNHVEIGALCTIASGTISPTILEDHVKLDDHIHVAHNCKIGRCAIITAGVTMSGGVTIGAYSWVGLHSSLRNKVSLANDTLVGAGSNVIKNTEPYDVIAGNPATRLRKRNKDNG